jgi:D-aspartate ligase
MFMRSKSTGKKIVVVFGAQHPTGLMTARALRQCHLDIYGVYFADSNCLRSNVWHTLIKAVKNVDDILEKLDNLARESGAELLLISADDECVKILSDNRDRLPSACTVILPDTEVVDLLLDKSKFYLWAEKHGFAFPATSSVRGFEELDEAINVLGYPLLLKPLYRTTTWDLEFPVDKVFILESRQHRLNLSDNLFNVASPVLVQQYIPGNDADIYFCLVRYNRDGNLVNYFCGRKLMQWPPLGGSTAIAISDELDETKEMTIAIFDLLKYKGLGSVEYKKDRRDGKFYIMEPTVGRNDFQSYLSVPGGVNLTRGLCAEMLGECPAPITRSRPSVWFCEPSMGYALKYYVLKRDFYFVKYFFSLFRRPGFAYFSKLDTAPFVELIKSRFRSSH